MWFDPSRAGPISTSDVARVGDEVRDKNRRPPVSISLALAQRAATSGPVVVGRLPDLGFIRDDSYDGAFCVLALEHIEDEGRLFAGRTGHGPAESSHS